MEPLEEQRSLLLGAAVFCDFYLNANVKGGSCEAEAEGSGTRWPSGHFSSRDCDGKLLFQLLQAQRTIVATATVSGCKQHRTL